MFKIYDGRNYFYQWDLDRKLIVDDKDIKQVHFCNRTDECSLVCETYIEDGLNVVNVPNVLLQDDWRINVYAYDVNYTKHSERFDVKTRSKPESYVYTETETLNFNTLADRITALEEGGVSGGGGSSVYVGPDEPEDELVWIDTDESASVDLNDYALKTDIPDVSGFALKSDIPDTTGFTTMAAVEAKGYQTEAQVNALINTALGVIENGSY